MTKQKAKDCPFAAEKISIYGYAVLTWCMYQLLYHIVAAGVDPDILKAMHCGSEELV